jgi:hypothetical protein
MNQGSGRSGIGTSTLPTAKLPHSRLTSSQNVPATADGSSTARNGPWALRQFKLALALAFLAQAQQHPVERILIHVLRSEQCSVHGGIDQLNAGGFPVLAQRGPKSENNNQ